LKKILLFITLLNASWLTIAQDTLTVMQYNLLYYGFNTSFCTSQNNNVNLKDQYLSTIIDYVNPDIFSVNELGRGQENVNRILNNVLNTGGQNRFSAATYTNTTNSTIVNMLFYDHNKFTLYFEAVVSSVVRDINLYTLYYNDEEMLAAGDTIFLTSIVAHFKAGSSSADQQTRTAEAQAVMAYLNSSSIRGNLLFMGDFNMNSSFEQAYQHITFYPNETIRFYDPINKPGQWYNNSDMAAYHTQSTRTGSHSCFVTGGLDDRYDIILASDAVIRGYMGLQYIDGTYKALGQDGNRYNQSLISPTNNSAPQNVIEALYGMSDHLPVIVKLQTGAITVSTQSLLVESPKLNFSNPAGNELLIKLNQEAGPVTISLYSVTGEKMLSFPNQALSAEAYKTFDVSSLPSGVYVIKIEGRKIRPISAKFIKI
jgi:endonuclease/exonuclease/phosphatase family metal-dependent hydrolase